MINVSNDFKEKMKESRDFKSYAEITFPNGEVLTLDSTQFIASNNRLYDGSDISSFPIGIAVKKDIQIEILNDVEQYKAYDFAGAKIRNYLDFRLNSDTTERIEKGTYTVVTPETYGETVIITAYDDMYKADKNYTTALTFPQAASAVLRDICSTCDITLGSTTFLHDDFIIQNKPSGKFREIIGYIAMIACGNARIDNRNRLQVIPYDFIGFETDGNYHVLSEWKAPKIEYNDSMITGFKTVIKGETSENDVDVIAGTDAYVITVDNPLIAGHEQTVLSWLLESVGNVPFRPFSGDLISNPLIEFMDLVKVQDRRGHLHKSFITDVNFLLPGYTTVKNSSPSMEKAAMSYTSEASKVEIRARKLVEQEKTDRELAVDRLNQALKDSSGMYSTEEVQLDGSTIYYLHDKPTIAESKNVMKLTAEAIGFSVDGGKTYPFGLSIDGELIMRIIQTEGLNADWINAGDITVRDNNGNIIFSVNMDTKQVIISGDHVQIDGKTATAAINEALEEAQKARNLNIILDNEYQGISADYQGNITTFPEVKTYAQVLYGNTDVSSECTYSIAKSSGIAGTWDNTRRTYTVTELTTDTGWVDITASYLNLLIATKRFNVSKIKDGSPGEKGADGRIYWMEYTADVIKQGKDGELTPAYIDFGAYYRNGTSATRTAYAGRFKIEESTDGNTWTTMYTSTANESSVRYALYTFLTDDDGNALIDDDGYGIAATRDFTMVRCTLYAAGGATSMLDTQTIVKVIDANALTPEEVFNILTNNGEVKGIYKEGNQLYISFTYAKGGELTLGGAGNSYGKLKILDETGTQIGNWDKDGLEFSRKIGSWIFKSFIGAIKTWYYQSELNRGGFMVASDFSGNVDGRSEIILSPAPRLNSSSYTHNAYNILSSNRDLLIESKKGSSNFWSAINFGGEGTASGGIKLLTGNKNTSLAVLEVLRSQSSDNLASVNLTSYGEGIVKLTSSKYVSIGTKAVIPLIYFDTGLSSPYIQNYGGAVRINGSLEVVNGSKSRVAETDNYGDRLLYCYEMPSPMFGDVGEAETDENGECYIYLDDIFSETVAANIEYQVFLQKEGPGDIWIIEKNPVYFAVKGTKNLRFAWEIKMKQRNYEYERVETPNQFSDEEEIDYESEYMQEIIQLMSEQEEILYETA